MNLSTLANAAITLLILAMLEIVLSIDNIIFISILAGKLPEHEQVRGRSLGLGLALITRVIFLLSITWIMSLSRPLFEIFGHAFSWRDLILISGGLFLIYKSTKEIHRHNEPSEERRSAKKSSGIMATVFQIVLIDIVFSVDSVITAVGMAQQLWIMIGSVVIAMIAMILAAGAIGRFIHRHPTIKILALAFLILVGVVLIADGIGQHIDRGYVYFAMAFSTAVELLNMRARRANPPLQQ
jgi:predicted tellurium resistance membrane protein TerC